MSSQPRQGAITWLGNRATIRRLWLIFTGTSVLLVFVGAFVLSDGYRGDIYRAAAYFAAGVVDLILGFLVARANTGVTGDGIIVRPAFSVVSKRIGWGEITGFTVARREGKGASASYQLMLRVVGKMEPITAPFCSFSGEAAAAALAADLEARRQQHVGQPQDERAREP